MNFRTDSWASTLTEDQAWQLFYKCRECRRWDIAAKWAAKEFKLPRVPKRTAFYAWRDAMQEEEHTHRIAQSLLAQQEAREVAEKYQVTDEESVNAIMSAATSATILTNDPKLAHGLIEMAMMIKDRQHRAQEIEIEKRKIEVKEDELRIAKRRLEIYEAERARVCGTLQEKKLSPEEREAKIREIFGL